MKILSKGTDGGDKSNVTGFWLVEIKSLLSIVLLKFEKGSRENYHNHAFNAWTWFLKGEVNEHHKDGRVLNWKPSWKPKYTPKTCFHKVHAFKRTYALSLRGPWNKTWKEYNPTTQEEITLTNGRIKVHSRREGMSEGPPGREIRTGFFGSSGTVLTRQEFCSRLMKIRKELNE